jgi:hypothetical protein
LNETGEQKGIVVPGRRKSSGKIRRPSRSGSDSQKGSSAAVKRLESRPSKRAAAKENEGSAPARLPDLPPEIGVLLTVVGTAGLVLPGVVGAPFLLAGGIALWPSGFRKVESWLRKSAPKMYETGVQQIEHFLADLERRYPDPAR